MSKKKIVLIEDDEKLCRFLKAFILEWGFDLVVANDGEEGLKAAQAEKPDLIILDLGLPKLPGEEVCRRLRNDERTSQTPILMETAKTSDTDRVVGKVIGANSYLTKPYSTDQLHKEINKLI